MNRTQLTSGQGLNPFLPRYWHTQVSLLTTPRLLEYILPNGIYCRQKSWEYVRVRACVVYAHALCIYRVRYDMNGQRHVRLTQSLRSGTPRTTYPVVEIRYDACSDWLWSVGIWKVICIRVESRGILRAFRKRHALHTHTHTHTHTSTIPLN